MTDYPLFLAILGGVALDLVLGDPAYLPHPVRWMGRAIEILEPRFRSLGLPLVFSGLLFALALPLGVWGAAWGLCAVAGEISPWLRGLVETLMVYYTVSAKGLKDAAVDVLDSLDKGDLARARRKTGMIVGRETAGLDEQGITRAVVETVAENLVDGVVSPLFFAVLGGGPLAMAYKMVNTLDSMVGYRNPTYEKFGKVSARLDDAVNFIPARLAVGVIACCARLLSGSPTPALKTAVTEGKNHKSPNAGYPEAAFAGALAVRLGGTNIYHGRPVEKPVIGAAFPPPEKRHIQQACRLMLVCSLVFTAAAALVAVF